MAIVIEIIDRFANIRVRFAPALADFEKFRRRQLPAPLTHNLGAFEKNLSALVRRRVAPLGEKARGLVDRLFSISDRRWPHPANDFIRISGIHRFKPVTASASALFLKFAANLAERRGKSRPILCA